MFLIPLARRVASAFFALCLGYATHASAQQITLKLHPHSHPGGFQGTQAAFLESMGHQVARHPWRDAGGDAGWPSAGRFVEACHRRRRDAMGDHSKPEGARVGEVS